MIGLAPDCVSDTAELLMAGGSRIKCWNGPSCPWRARGVCLFGHEHGGDQGKEEAICELSSQDRGQQREVKQVVEVSEISKKKKKAETFFDFF